MTNLAPSLSVVMPAYNAEAFIDHGLDSLLGQTRRDFEVIVVDDGSQDRTAERVRERRDHAPVGGPDIRVFAQPNAGPSAARNRAIREARAPLIGFLDADDLWAPDKVARHLELMAAHPQTLLSFSGFRFIDGTGTDLCEVMLPPQETVPYEKLLERNCIHTSAVIARRDTILAVGGFDEHLRTYEDFDLWLRIAAQGPDSVRAILAPLTDYRRHGVQATNNWRRMHDGWQTVINRQKDVNPQAWARVSSLAWGHQLEYCAALAYNAGDIDDMRRLIRQCWQKGGLRMIGQYYALLMTGISIASYLPRPIQIALGAGFVRLRRAYHWLSGRGRQDPPGHSFPA